MNMQLQLQLLLLLLLLLLWLLLRSIALRIPVFGVRCDHTKATVLYASTTVPCAL